VTYGAGGSTRERTHKTIKRILDDTKLKPASHLTCVNATREDIAAIAKDYWQMGVRHIVALRGDAPAGSGTYTPTPGGYAYGADLVKGLKEIADFEISVAAYPETHPEATSAEADLDYLKKKCDAGATRAITQYFFDVDVFLRFKERCDKAGITVPIVPGILPIHQFSQMVKFSRMCGASVPGWLKDLLEPLDNDPEIHRLISILIAAEQCKLLAERGFREFHFYTLNRAELTYAVCHLLGIRKP
jgi:methylenetetrahydrofolate reductase (NADPH)